MDYKKMIPGCFEVADGIFSGHSADCKRAAEMLVEALKKEVSWEKFEKSLKDFMKEKGWTTKHIDEQIERIADLKNYFPYD